MQPKPKKDGPLSLEEAIDDSENLTDFLLDFEEEWLMSHLKSSCTSSCII